MEAFKGPWRLVSVQAPSKGLDVDKMILEKGLLIWQVPFASENRDHMTWDLVVVERHLSRLVLLLKEFTIDLGYDPIRPTEKECATYGQQRAQERAHHSFLKTAHSAIIKEWSPGPALCYRRIAAEKGLSYELAMIVIQTKTQVSHMRSTKMRSIAYDL